MPHINPIRPPNPYPRKRNATSNALSPFGKTKERSTIAPFLQSLQEEEILKYVNISAITLSGGEVDVGEGNSSGDVVDDAVQKTEDSWKFTLVIKTKGGAQ